MKTIREGVEKDSELKQFWFNARHGGKAGTQLESWTQDVWVEAMKLNIRRLLKEQRADIVRELKEILNNEKILIGLDYHNAIKNIITKLEQGEEK